MISLIQIIVFFIFLAFDPVHPHGTPDQVPPRLYGGGFTGNYTNDIGILINEESLNERGFQYTRFDRGLFNNYQTWLSKLSKQDKENWDGKLIQKHVEYLKKQ